jgi:hypothetical protein
MVLAIPVLAPAPAAPDVDDVGVTMPCIEPAPCIANAPARPLLYATSHTSKTATAPKSVNHPVPHSTPPLHSVSHNPKIGKLLTNSRWLPTVTEPLQSRRPALLSSLLATLLISRFVPENLLPLL